MVAIASGLWWDHSKTTVLAATLTLPLEYSNLLLSGLTILVTIAGSSFWNIVAFALHDWKARNENPSALDLQHQLESPALNFSTAQVSTADRILYALAQSNTYTAVANLGTAALWANNMVTGHVSVGLPDDQWKTEVIGWFQTNLAMLQAYVIDFASNTADLGAYGYVEPPRSSHQRDQCTNQLVQAVGEVQNFSVCGVLIIICVSAVLILLDCSLERIADFIDDFCKRDAIAKRARQGDNKLHLLRMALGGNDWVLGRWDIPVRDGAEKYNRPCGSKKLVSYGGSNTGLTREDTEFVQVDK
ncbi:hypothetical protein FPRO03_07059 [Fusarium proliferatum]|nr:hypothetical protein FPRO03_07059 [Fusarium proliferatum]